ncbi:MAG: type II toxin-antitoxin system YafQ family toxin [Candidatus Uhrbacteria bacterium]|nr:type II toxin-antitoxin system YafQ family toxin [Candidatus Uhrbacteria bacterium]
MIQRGKDRKKLLDVARLLVNDGSLSTEYRPHKLHGEYAGLWECHIESDWLLIYDVTEEKVFLARTGTHADLFE